jgi:hypothetical protein
VLPATTSPESNLLASFGKFLVETLHDTINIDPKPLIAEAGDLVPIWKTKNIYDINA